MTVLIFFLILNTSIFKKAKMLFPVVETFKSVCVHVRLGAFAYGCQPQMSPTPSSTVKFFFPSLCSGGHELGNQHRPGGFNVAQGLCEHPANYLGIRLRKVKAAQLCKGHSKLAVGRSSSRVSWGSPRPTPELMFMRMYVFRVSVPSDCLSPYSQFMLVASLLPLPCQALFHGSKVRAAVFVTNVCLSRVKPEMGALALPWCL